MCSVLHDLVPFVQFKKRENIDGRVLLLEPATLLKVTLPHGCFSSFLNCTNGTKSRNAISYLRWNMMELKADDYFHKRFHHRMFTHPATKCKFEVNK